MTAKIISFPAAKTQAQIPLQPSNVVSIAETFRLQNERDEHQKAPLLNAIRTASRILVNGALFERKEPFTSADFERMFIHCLSKEGDSIVLHFDDRSTLNIVAVENITPDGGGMLEISSLTPLPSLKTIQ
jgi:hypothetical protein